MRARGYCCVHSNLVYTSAEAGRASSHASWRPPASCGRCSLHTARPPPPPRGKKTLQQSRGNVTRITQRHTGAVCSTSMDSTCWARPGTLHAPLALGQVGQRSAGGEVRTPRDTKVPCSAHTLDPTAPGQNKGSLFRHDDGGDTIYKHSQARLFPGLYFGRVLFDLCHVVRCLRAFSIRLHGAVVYSPAELPWGAGQTLPLLL